jgi:transposase
MTIQINDATTALVLQDEIRRNDEARYDHKLHAVLLAAKEMTCPQIARLLGDSERTVRNWIGAYLRDGLQGLVDKERAGRPRRLTAAQIADIETALRLCPDDVGLTGGIWDGKMLAAYIGEKFSVDLSVRQCQRLFRELGFRLRKPRPMIARSDPAIQHAFKKKYGGTFSTKV